MRRNSRFECSKIFVKSQVPHYSSTGIMKTGTQLGVDQFLAQQIGRQASLGGLPRIRDSSLSKNYPGVG